MDQSKKTMRHFYCRDVLWETFEQMANDFDCSIDYLINESMRYYARSKNYPAAGAGQAGLSSSAGMPAQQPGASPGSPPPSMQARRPAPTTSPPGHGGNNLSSQPPTAPQAPRRPAPPTPAGHIGAAPLGAGPMGAMGGPGLGASGLGAASPRPGATPGYAAPQPVAPAAAMGAGPTLYLMFNGQRYPVTKDQFIIGRGSKTSDLAIKDGNISRKHAAVIRRNGTFYIKDLGSTNGIDYKGMRIDNKRIDEGDVFHLCDYELRFTYRTE
ncbi:MAG TPA: FHA domain-containing protein [Kofleriaceae bacterium]|nr:FHA domain-containing protein [Kofleriaceae bacterium]